MVHYLFMCVISRLFCSYMTVIVCVEADLAITVTDGFIAGQAAGFNVQLVGTYVDSPLTWAVSAHPASPYSTIEDMFQKKGYHSGSHLASQPYICDYMCNKSSLNVICVHNFCTDTINVGISRLQSGSHTMSYYMADLLAKKQLVQSRPRQQEPAIKKNQLHFKVLGSFSNLRDGNFLTISALFFYSNF